MGFNEGFIYTNDNCIGCNRCISGCPVLGANISVKLGSRGRVYVDGDACIQCGKCLKLCRHGAREYRDDTQRLLDDLRAKKQIRCSLTHRFLRYTQTGRRSCSAGSRPSASARFMMWATARILRSGRTWLIRRSTRAKERSPRHVLQA